MGVCQCQLSQDLSAKCRVERKPRDAPFWGICVEPRRFGFFTDLFQKADFVHSALVYLPTMTKDYSRLSFRNLPENLKLPISAI